MNDLERQQKLDKLKKRMLEMSATIAEQEEEIALNERVLNLVLEDHVCHSSNETVQSFIEVMTKGPRSRDRKTLKKNGMVDYISICLTSCCGNTLTDPIAIIAHSASFARNGRQGKSRTHRNA